MYITCYWGRNKLSGNCYIVSEVPYSIKCYNVHITSLCKKRNQEINTKSQTGVQDQIRQTKKSKYIYIINMNLHDHMFAMKVFPYIMPDISKSRSQSETWHDGVFIGDMYAVT